ncbi:hypothetical protein L861_06415 [Litchfieldella anticariensis FP35 = DSM 16096]|uniref:Uncharacterized protein n=1 Tax=Litchfieldella anticariensis (strain DSM 16096 / CECT 5854 / CIP 108499 / LMG 22089 / FP35) TaxID=1121939 RepID=S2KEF4_LITA3|nr:hypothetical protein L861_06415 [Halomonas anticariensis FP35 = DSM 16096]
MLRFRDELELVQLKLRQQAIDLANAYNQELLKNTGIVLRPHWRKNEIACSLRWRDRHQHRMGLRLWEATVAQAGPGMREALVDMEVERCLFNGAVSVVSRQLWRVRRVLADIEHAESYLLANSRDKNTGNIGESDTR